MPIAQTVSQTSLAALPLIGRGKVRDVYEAGENHLLMVATDRISAFDCILPTAIPEKGRVLTELSIFWFERLRNVIENHFVSNRFDDFPAEMRAEECFRGRSMLVKKTKVFPVECVVRGYLEGSGWKDYLATGKICGHILPQNLRRCEKLPAPVFTPATKAVSGHDENIGEDEFKRIVGFETAEFLRSVSLRLYEEAAQFALTRGIIIADTKFEFGADEDGNILLIDEALTPDSSRFWALEDFAPGSPQPSFDKQFVREYLETLDWNKQPPAPPLPSEIVRLTTNRYLAAYEILTGNKLG